MDLNLKGKRAAVAGATRGIGRAIAEHLASEGCHVAICARDGAAVDQAVAELQQAGVTVFGAAVDVTDGPAQTEWINKSVAVLGGLDIFIANVSALSEGVDAESWQHSFEVDMMGTFHGVSAVVPHLKDSEAGSIVLISSIAALHVPNGPKPYGAMKAAVINYAKGLARLLARDGVRVNTVSPGNIYFEGGVWGETERKYPKFFKRQLAANPMGRMGTPDEVAQVVLFLASPKAGFVSGTNMVVDGALTVGVQY